MNIVFDFENENGFFCLFFFFLQTYIYCCKNNKILYIKDDKWKFKFEKGLDDYFELNHIQKYTPHLKNTIFFCHMNVPNINLKLNDYITYSKELFKIKPSIIKTYNLPKLYNSIFIRGGDKLLYEAKQLPISMYVHKLLSINNNKNVFVHSDDNLLVEEVIQYIFTHNIDLKVFKITNHTNNGGAVVMKRLQYGKCKHIKSLDDMKPLEIKEHVTLMLNAFEIMSNSLNVITSYDTNVSRFMKINFHCNVYSINGNYNLFPEKEINNPAYGFV